MSSDPCSRRRRTAAGRVSVANAVRIESPVFLQAVLRSSLELVEIPASLGHADDRHVQVSPFHHRLQRREDLLVCQIASGTKEDECIGMGRVHDKISIRRLATKSHFKVRCDWLTRARVNTE